MTNICTIRDSNSAESQPFVFFHLHNNKVTEKMFRFTIADWALDRTAKPFLNLISNAKNLSPFPSTHPPLPTPISVIQNFVMQIFFSDIKLNTNINM